MDLTLTSFLKSLKLNLLLQLETLLMNLKSLHLTTVLKLNIENQLVDMLEDNFIDIK